MEGALEAFVKGPDVMTSFLPFTDQLATQQDQFCFSRPLQLWNVFTLYASLHPYQKPTFSILLMFDIYFWSCLICTLLIVAAIHAALERSMKHGVRFLFSYSMLLLSECMVHRPIKWRQRFISGPITILTVVFLSCL